MSLFRRFSHATQSQRKLMVAIGIFVVLAILLPAQVIHAFDWVGYAVCHRIPERSFIIGGNQLPMCARDTGMFGVALLGVLGAALASPLRHAQFPKLSYCILLALGALMWAADGLNSYLMLATGRVWWYMPQNWLRLVTGALMGAGVSALIVPLFNMSVWRSDLRSNQPFIQSWRGLAFVWGIGLGWVLLVLLQLPPLYGLYAAVSATGTLMLLTVVNSLITLLIMGRDAQVTAWAQLRVPMLLGFVLTLGEIGLIAGLRMWLTVRLGLPF